MAFIAAALLGPIPSLKQPAVYLVVCLSYRMLILI